MSSARAARWRLACGLLAAASTIACRRTPTSAVPDAGPTAAHAPVVDLRELARAEDRRSAKELAAALAGELPADLAVRRLATRGLARIGDEAAAAALLARLADEDPEIVMWSAYGLGYACKLQPDVHVRALVARATTFEGADAGASSADARFAIARALGRCGTEVAERTLASWRKSDGAMAEASGYALGDIAARRTLSDESMTVLLEAVTTSPARQGDRGALFPWSRMTPVPESFRPRLREVARAALAGPGETRIFAVRALAKAQATDELRAVALDGASTLAERIEAARGLEKSGTPGRAAALFALERLSPYRELASGAGHHLLVALLTALGKVEGKEGKADGAAQKTLFALASLPLPEDPKSPVARGIVAVRCEAALGLAHGDDAAEVLVRCGPDGDATRERAVLRSLVSGGLVGARRGRFLALAKNSRHLRVREAALEATATHPELGVDVIAPVRDALLSKKAGLVATAADLIKSNPSRFFAPGPRAKLAPEIEEALKSAAETPWSEDLVETKGALLDASVASLHPMAKALALAACAESNTTLRQKGKQALASLSEPATTKCEGKEAAAAPELDSLLARPTKVIFSVSGAELTVAFDPSLAPVTATRMVSLAKSGFFRGVVVHRVVPAFVVQLGDPGGDGYGGSGKLLRCETSPAAFRPLDVGMALAGRDTGSSQFFVTLSRVPHLDGDYAHVGRASGPWDAVAEGDVVDDVKVQDGP